MCGARSLLDGLARDQDDIIGFVPVQNFDMTQSKAPVQREMYAEIAALIGSLAKTFAIKDSEAAAAVESGAMALDFAADANGNRFVAARYQGKVARIYQGAIKHADSAP